MKISKVLENVSYDLLTEFQDTDVQGIEYNSKKIKEGYIFVAIKGFKTDGHKYIESAIENGAKVIVLEDKPEFLKEGITYILLKNTRKTLSLLASNFYSNPSKDMIKIGITGTNGKTTTTYIVQSILETIDRKVGIVGTIGSVIGGKITKGETTTPESSDLQKILYDMKQQNVDTLAMEVSSHALELNRVEAITYDVSLFTNLSVDHLDYHHTLEEYLKAKEKLFFKTDGYSVINEDDIYGKKVIKDVKEKIITYGLEENEKHDIMARNIELFPTKTRFTCITPMGDETITINSPGIFSVYNTIGAIGIIYALKKLGKINISMDSIKKGIEKLGNVKGRFEVVETKKDFSVIIDFAHTPDALENALKTLKKVIKGRLIVIFGAGGDRDRSKRPIMGETVGRYADLSIVTSDNPRTENPENIVDDVIVGTKKTKGDYKKIVDRKEAIKFAIENAQKDDTIVLAGKGHETYIEINNKRFDFDEREIVKEYL